MGCWNKTCGLSNLHIRSGDDVMVFVLEKNTRDDDRCYTTAFYRPLLLPFYSKYNDYGGGEEDHGVALNLIMDGIKNSLVEVEQGPNEYHDIPVTKDKFDVELFYEAVHEQRLEVKRGTPVEFVMFRKDIVDDLLNTYTVQSYVGQGKGTTGWDNSYITYKFSDVLADAPAVIAKLEGIINNTTNSEVPEYLKDLPKELQLQFILRDLNELFDDKDPNKASWYLRFDNHRYSTIVNIHHELIELVSAGKTDQAEAILKEFLTASFLDNFMSDVRKLWMPGGHEGSQSQELDGYQALIDTMSRAIKAERQEADEESDE